MVSITAELRSGFLYGEGRTRKMFPCPAKTPVAALVSTGYSSSYFSATVPLGTSVNRIGLQVDLLEDVVGLASSNCFIST